MSDIESNPIIEERRPGVVTFVAILLYIQAAMALLTGGLAFIGRNEADVQASIGLEGDQFVWLLIVELVIALVLLIVAGGIMSGARWARMLVTIGMGLRLVQAAFFASIGGEGNAGILAAVLYALIPLIVLWAVWGSDKGEAWFHQMTDA